MRSVLPTLLDPFELPRPRLVSESPTEWFARAVMPTLSRVARIIESSETPPWSPEPVDRRWRARGWAQD